MEEFIGGNACEGEPTGGNGLGKCSVGEPAEGSFIIYVCTSTINVLLLDFGLTSIPILVFTVSETPKYY